MISRHSILLLCLLCRILTRPSHGLSTMLSSSPRVTTPTRRRETRQKRTALTAVKTKQAVVDGAECKSILKYLHRHEKLPLPPSTKNKDLCVKFSVGATIKEDGTRVVGMVASEKQSDKSDDNAFTTLDTVAFFPDSLAEIPKGISDDQAISTMIHSLILHCALPLVNGVGGSETASLYKSASMVVLGGNPHATTQAQALAAVGCQVSLVTTEKNVNLPQRYAKSITVYPPAVGAAKEGFCNWLDSFDAILDTVGDEHDSSMNLDSNVIKMLSDNHDCHVYVSSLTRQQALLTKGGVFGGPNQAKQHAKSILARDMASIPSPARFGETVAQILQGGVTFDPIKEETYLRGWAWGPFWEGATWPRNAKAATSIRFGLPATEDVDLLVDDEEPMLAAPPSFERTEASQVEADDEMETPEVMRVSGVRGLQEQVVDAELDCLLFVSARFCRTCKYLGPQYQRLARQNNGKLVFAKADATGPMGKALGRKLGVDSVPAFILYKSGRRFGNALSISRLPSKQLDVALEYMESGQAWDNAAVMEAAQLDNGGKPPRGPTKI